jgi:hypothetical protein
VVEELKVEQSCRRNHLRRQPQVLLRRFRVAARMVMDECKTDTAPIYNWAEQFGDAHARPRRRSYIHLVQTEQPVTSINHSYVKFFLLASRKQRRSERSKVRRRLHALTPRRPPRGRRL